MKRYHISVLFKGSGIKHHSEFVTAIEDKDGIVKKAKLEFARKLPGWKRDAMDITCFEVYYYNDEHKQVEVFKYEL